MRSKTILIIVILISAGIIIVGSFAGGVITGRLLLANRIGNIGSQFDPMNLVSAGDSAAAGDADTPEDLEELFKPFWQSWDIVHNQYVEQPVDDTALMRGAISGMLESLGDEHTSYLDPDIAARFQAVLEGEEYEGIGAWVDTGGEYLTIISPIPNSPAEAAGLQSGDQIIAIDGEDMTGVDPELARQRVLGPKGSIVTLTILREGTEEPFDVEIKRESIVVPTVESRMLEDENIGYVLLYTFGGDTGGDLRKALKERLSQNPDGLILDLRNNGGGYLNTAIEVVSEFIDEGIVMYEEHGAGAMDTFKARGGGQARDIALVVLVNSGSASASEIVAGAIQDRDRGVLVGTTSFGKGSVQTVANLVNEQGQIRVTIARWLTPDKRQINGVGLEPDYVIELTEEDIAEGRDLQLQKAIELLR